MSARAVVIAETIQAPCDIGWEAVEERKRELMKLETRCGVVQWCCSKSCGKVVGKNRTRRTVLGKEEGERRILNVCN